MAHGLRTTVIVVGGRVRPTTLGAVDAWATRMLERMEPDLAFMGANGITDDGWLTTPDPAVGAVKETALGCARRAVLVGSHDKLYLNPFSLLYLRVCREHSCQYRLFRDREYLMWRYARMFL